MPSQKAVCVRVTSVTQPNTTFLAPPRTVNAFLCGLTSFTPASLVPVWVTVTLHLDGEVSKWQGTKKTSTTAWAAPRALVTNELFGQIYSVLLDVGDSILGVLAEKNVSVRYGDIEQKVENILVKLPTLRPALIIPPFLISPVRITASGHSTSTRDPSFSLRCTVPVVLVDCIQSTWPSQLSCPSMRMHRHCRTEK